MIELDLVEKNEKSHSTRIRETVLDAIPDLECVQNIKTMSWELVFDNDLIIIVYEMSKHDILDKVMPCQSSHTHARRYQEIKISSKARFLWNVTTHQVSKYS